MVSIIITVYNLQDYIKTCLNSVLTQSYEDLQIILVNDCSTDNSLSILEEYAKKDKRIEIINNKKNLGAGMSRRIGISHAKGEYINLLDGDDYISKDYIKILVEISKKYNSDMVTANVKMSDGSKDFMFGEFINEYKTVEEKGNFLYEQGMSFMNNKLIKKELFDNVEYSDKRYVEDAPTLYKLLFYAKKIITISNKENNCIYYYVKRENSLTHDTTLEKYWLFQALFGIDTYNFYKDKSRKYRYIFNKFDLKNYIGNFLNNKSIDLNSCKKNYPMEYNEFMAKYNILKDELDETHKSI